MEPEKHSIQNQKPILGHVGEDVAKTRLARPLVYQGNLRRFKHFELTPAIGREYTDMNLQSLLTNPDGDSAIRDLAVVISQRGVVVLRSQHSLSPLEMRDFIGHLSHLAGAPTSSTLHIHPLTEEGSELGDHISVISSIKQQKGGGLNHRFDDSSRFASVGWHSDITFEVVPSDYAMLKIHTLPSSGGDTLWASGYEIFDRLSKPVADFLETLSATHDASFFHEEADRLGNGLREGQRGSPLNQGRALTARHPVVRTNPVTGWKSVFVNRGFTKRINEVTKDESDLLLGYLFNLITQNHDAQVRIKWSVNDVAIWDNRSNWHCATYDYGTTPRIGDRVASLGEKPFLDTQSRSRRGATVSPFDNGSAK